MIRYILLFFISINAIAQLPKYKISQTIQTKSCKNKEMQRLRGCNSIYSPVTQMCTVREPVIYCNIIGTVKAIRSRGKNDRDNYKSWVYVYDILVEDGLILYEDILENKILKELK